MENNQRHPNFPSKTPKNGSRNPKEPKDLNPHITHVRVLRPVSREFCRYRQHPRAPGRVNEPIGKFPMTDSWYPSRDFRRRAALWGMALPEPEFTPAELAAFRDTGLRRVKFSRRFSGRKFARHVNHVRAQVKPVSKGAKPCSSTRWHRITGSSGNSGST